MIVVMKPGATPKQVEHVIDLVHGLGLRSHVIVGTDRTVVAALGEKRDGAKQALETGEGVEKVVPILAPYKMASTEVKQDPTCVEVLGLKAGAGHIGVIAGPCSVESREQILETAQVVKEAGAAGLRGGAFKPRTSPYSFQGMKEKGLELLALARDETGLAVVTEVMAPEHVALVARYADVLQVGARNMQNYPLLEAVGESGVPVLLKRGPAATMDEFLLAAEYILKTGNHAASCCASAASARSRTTHASRCRSRRSRTCGKRRTCRSWSTPATAPARRAWSRRWPSPPSPPAPTA